MLEQMIHQVSTWLKENGSDLLIKVVIFVAILVIFKILAGFVRSLVRRAVSSSKLDISELLQDFFVSVASKLTMVIGFLVALSQFGVEIGPLVASLGVAGFIVDFVVRPWAKTSDYWDVYWDVTREVKKRFDSEGISIPYPQTDIHLHQQTAQSA